MFGLSLSQIVLLPAGLALLVAALVAVRRWPKPAIASWLVVLVFVPFWIRAPGVNFLQPAAVLGILLLLGTRPKVRRFGFADLLIAFLFVACVAPIAFGGSTLSTVVGAIGQWLVAYLVGRVLPELVGLSFISTVMAIVFAAAALLAVIEFAAGWNPFVTLGPPTQLHQNWAELQIRGDLVRAEGAFGHSIALGCSLAMAIPLVLVCPVRPALRVLMTIVICAGVVVTISRVSILGAALSLVLCIALLRDGIPRSVKITLGASLGIGALVVAPTLLAVFAAAGDEATNSANYRGDLTELLPDVALLGLSPAAYRSPTGEVFFGRFQSIDSQLIFTGLTYGWIALVCGLVLLATAVVLVLTGRSTAPTIAVVGQLPALLTVALITQYSMVFWFVCGLAVFSQIDRSRVKSGPDGTDLARTVGTPAKSNGSVMAVTSPPGRLV